MKIGPKYKIAKRLGAPIFEKTQSQKFAISEGRGEKKKSKRPGQMSDYKKQLFEKQKMRFTYGITERQLRRYVDEATTKSKNPLIALVERLESRLDNVVYRLGLAKTRRAARQMVSHGHICVNGRRSRVPSQAVKVGDAITVRAGSKESGLYVKLLENYETAGIPAWLSFDVKQLQGEMKTIPTYEPSETLFDPKLVLEFYSR